MQSLHFVVIYYDLNMTRKDEGVSSKQPKKLFDILFFPL